MAFWTGSKALVACHVSALATRSLRITLCQYSFKKSLGMPQDQLYFNYGALELEHLRRRDRALGRVIDALGMLRREVQPDLFSALLKSIVGQQVSSQAQKTIWGRLLTLLGEPPQPQSVAAYSAEELQACGMTMRKAGYIKEIAQQVITGELKLDELKNMPDEQLCKRLCQLKGVGPWTAEMLMIFSLQRPNVLSWGDLAIQRGMRMLYRHRRISPELFAKYKKRYSPYASVASLYLWELSHDKSLNLSDPGATEKPGAD
jgi:DNA-3-methyladenine glycosylase II